MSTLDYKSENCTVDFGSGMTPEEAERVIGKTISRVDASEYNLVITFNDNSTLDINGSRWDDCAMGVDYHD